MSGLDAAKVAFTVGPAHPPAEIPRIPFAVRAAVAWWSCQPEHGSRPGNRGGIGLWAPGGAVSVAWSSEDAAPSISTRTATGDAALLGIGAGGAREMRAELDVRDEGTLALGWIEPPREVWTVHLLALGEPVAATAGWTEDLASLAGSDLVLAVPTAADELVIGFGAAGRKGAGAAAYSARDSARPGSVLAAQRLGAPTVEPGRRHAFLAVDGVRAKVAADTSSARPGRRFTRVGFAPDALLLFSWGLAPSRETRGIGRLCVGAAAGGARGCTSWDDCNVESPATRTHVASSDERALLVADTQTGGVHAEADVSVRNGGFALDWIRSDGHRRELVYVALAGRQRSASSSGT